MKPRNHNFQWDFDHHRKYSNKEIFLLLHSTFQIVVAGVKKHVDIRKKKKYCECALDFRNILVKLSVLLPILKK